MGNIKEGKGGDKRIVENYFQPLLRVKLSIFVFATVKRLTGIPVTLFSLIFTCSWIKITIAEKVFGRSCPVIVVSNLYNHLPTQKAKKGDSTHTQKEIVIVNAKRRLRCVSAQGSSKSQLLCKETLISCGFHLTANILIVIIQHSYK